MLFLVGGPLLSLCLSVQFPLLWGTPMERYFFRVYYNSVVFLHLLFNALDAVGNKNSFVCVRSFCSRGVFFFRKIHVLKGDSRKYRDIGGTLGWQAYGMISDTSLVFRLATGTV